MISGELMEALCNLENEGDLKVKIEWEDGKTVYFEQKKVPGGLKRELGIEREDEKTPDEDSEKRAAMYLKLW